MRVLTILVAVVLVVLVLVIQQVGSLMRSVDALQGFASNSRDDRVAYQRLQSDRTCALLREIDVAPAEMGRLGC